MKTTTSILSLVLLLAGCAGTGTEYRAASRSGGYGYTDQQIASNRYQVTYVARGDDPAAASDLALLRASELTLLDGNDWFEVASRELVIEGERRGSTLHSTGSIEQSTTTRCGLLSCSSTTQPVYRSSVGMDHGGRQRTTVVLEFITGNGTAPAGATFYAAKDVADTIRNRRT